MARYVIDELNYIAAANGRTFINMDVKLDGIDDVLADYAHILAVEPNKGKLNPLSNDILLERFNGEELKTRYIAEVSSVGQVTDSHGRTTPETEKTLSALLSAIAEESDLKSIILNEKQPYFNETSSDKSKFVRLYLSCCTEAFRKQLSAFYLSHQYYGHTYVIEHLQNDMPMTSSSGTKDVHPIYDIDDVALKSANKTGNHFVKDTTNFDYDDYDHIARQVDPMTEDYYIPQDASVVGFCQSENNALVLTSPTSSSPLQIRLKYDENDMGEVEADQSHYIMSLEDGKLKTYLYSFFKNGEQISSLSSAQQFFDEVSELKGLQYNYLADVPLDTIFDNCSTTDFGYGNVYCTIHPTKNMYNSTYSMEMDSSHLMNARSYAEVNTCRGQAYLKYYDNVSLSSGIISDSAQPYPKIEYIYPLVIKNGGHHKSYFFSIDIQKLDLGDPATKDGKLLPVRMMNEQQKLRNVIKRDITNAIREIAHVACPVQTQLFEVKFNGQT